MTDKPTTPLVLRTFKFEETVEHGPGYYIYKVKPYLNAQNTHHTLIKLQQITDDEQTKKDIALAKTREAIKCAPIRSVYGWAKVNKEGKSYIAYHYEKEEQVFYEWVADFWAPEHFNHRVMWKLAKRMTEALAYLQEHKLHLHEFNPKLIMMEMLTHDKGLFKLDFVGGKEPKGTGKIDFGEYSPPETDENQDVHKSYVFSLGLILLWVVLKCGNESAWKTDFSKNTPENQKLLKTLIKSSTELGQHEHFPRLLESMLEYDIKKRLSPKDLLEFGWEEGQYFRSVYNESDESEIEQADWEKRGKIVRRGAQKNGDNMMIEETKA